MRIGVIVAMEKELAQLRSLLDNESVERVGGRCFITGKIGQKDIVMQQCGIGKVNSAVGAAEMADRYRPDVIISSGCAGGADTSLEVGDVVVAAECAYHDAYCGTDCAYGQIMGMPARFACDVDLTAKALALDCGVRVRKGLTVSGDWFVDSREKMRSILERFPDATAVDMESCSIAHVCHLRKVELTFYPKSVSRTETVAYIAMAVLVMCIIAAGVFEVRKRKTAGR